MTPLYEKSLKDVRGYLGSEQVAGKRLREWVSVTDAQERLRMVRDARPAGEGLAFVRVKDEVAARPEIEGGNDEVEWISPSQLTRMTEEDCAELGAYARILVTMMI